MRLYDVWRGLGDHIYDLMPRLLYKNKKKREREREREKAKWKNTRTSQKGI